MSIILWTIVTVLMALAFLAIYGLYSLVIRLEKQVDDINLFYVDPDKLGKSPHIDMEV